MPIETRNGKTIPCNTLPIRYRAKPGADVKIVTKDGDVVCCEPFAEPAEATGWGYIPHDRTCEALDRFRKKGGPTT